MKLIYEYLLDTLSAGGKSVLLTVVEREGGVSTAPGAKRFWSKVFVAGSLGVDWLDRAADDLAVRAIETCQMEMAQISAPGQAAGRYTLVAEPFFPAGELVVLGGGNIARPLVQIASLLGYQVTVVDDRPDFACSGRFPEARRVICDDFKKALDSLTTLNFGTSVVIITRGHLHDLECLERAIKHDLAYIGMIGSKRKIKAAKEYLAAKGVEKSRIDKIYMPIGLDVGARTPEEIAVSIAAELVKARRGGAARSLAEVPEGAGDAGRGCLKSDTLVDLNLLKILVDTLKQGAALAMATVIAARGSAPRKAGAKMLILPDHSIYGTIGGGLIEEEVRKKGLALLSSGEPAVFKYSLDNEAAAGQGMICGGAMDIFVEPVKGE